MTDPKHEDLTQYKTLNLSLLKLMGIIGGAAFIVGLVLHLCGW